MAISEAKKAANKRWNDAHGKEYYDRINVLVPKGGKDQVKEYAGKVGESISGFMWKATKDRIAEIDRTETEEGSDN